MSHESFWDFSLRVYRLPHVGETCLALQNTYGLDVNVLLFACWHGRHFGPFSPGTLQAALQFSTQWSTHVVKSLRHARNWMKSALAAQDSTLSTLPGVTELREQIKAVELRGERLQQHALESLMRASPAVQRPVQNDEQASHSIQHNLQKIVEASALTLTPELTQHLEFLTRKALA